MVVNPFTILAAAATVLALNTVTRAGDATSEVCTAPAAEAKLEFSLPDLDGKPVGLNTFKGKVLVINFWASWCAPCKVEIPGLLDLYERYRRRGLEVVGIAVDEPVTVVRPYARAMRIKY